MNKIRVVVWGENVHEKRSEAVRKIYPEGMHQCIAKDLRIEGAFQVGTATLEEPEHGLPEARLSETDVLIWWGHLAHAEVSDQIVDREFDGAGRRGGFLDVKVCTGGRGLIL